MRENVEEEQEEEKEEKKSEGSVRGGEEPASRIFRVAAVSSRTMACFINFSLTDMHVN